MLTPSTILLQAILSFVATMGFAMLFQAPRRSLLACSLIGMGGYVLRFILREMGVEGDLSTFCGSLFVGLAGVPFSRWLRVPLVVFSITGIIDMIPGVPAFEILVYFNQGNIPVGLEKAVQAGFGVGAIAAGISTARILTDREWGFER